MSFSNFTNLSSTLIVNINNTLVHARHIPVACQVILTVSYAVGIIGNIAALTILCRSDTRTKNYKHMLMLRCLTANDLIALVGMLIQMNSKLYLPEEMAQTNAFCMFRVVWRLFGLGSGCVAIVMAIERWLALTRPFLYQKHVTYNTILRSIFCLWGGAAILTCLPFIGFGLYFDQELNECVRYRDATLPKDIAYAYLFFTFGSLLSVCIVCCNLGVIRELLRFGSQKQNCLGRISRSPSTSHCNGIVDQQGHILFNTATAEEVAFSKYMAVICISFVFCWMPQMIAIPLAQLAPHSKSKIITTFYLAADLLMALHFMFDPYIYVLLRYKRKPRKTRNRTNIIKMSTPSKRFVQATIQDAITPTAALSTLPLFSNGKINQFPNNNSTTSWSSSSIIYE